MRTHGPFSLSVAGLVKGPGHPWSAGLKAAVGWVASMGCRAIQLDGAFAGARARELDRSARRDVAALLRRHGLALSGIDLWIPREHFVSNTELDRAVAAVTATAQLAADLAGLVPGSAGIVGVTLSAGTTDGVVAELEAAAAAVGSQIADHTWPARTARGALGVGIDPAEILLAGADPAEAVSRLPAPPISARWSDLAPSGRVRPGTGRLDAMAYGAALSTRGYSGWSVVDLRGIPDQAAAAAMILAD